MVPGARTLPLGLDIGSSAVRWAQFAEHQGVAKLIQLGHEPLGLPDALPDALRLQMELLLYDIEDRETVEEGLAAFVRLARARGGQSPAVKIDAGRPADALSELTVLTQKVRGLPR